MNVLLVHPYPEPKSFTAAWHDHAVETLKSQGHQVQICGLYGINGASVEHFPVRGNRQQLVNTEQRLGDRNQTIATEFEQELGKLRWADLLILNFADCWFSAPAMLKAWIDHVRISGAFNGGKRFCDQDGLCGKKALVTVTLGGREHLYGADAIHGLLEDKLRPILCGTLDYVGLEVLPSLGAWSVPYTSSEFQTE